VRALKTTSDLDAKKTAQALSARVEERMYEAIEISSAELSVQIALPTQSGHYHLRGGGRRARAQLAIECGLALNVEASNIVAVAASSELIHNASLVHDDLQDKDPLRRGKAAVWSHFGNNIAVCTGDLMLSAAYGCLAPIQPIHVIPTLITVLQKRIGQAIAGQCADLTFRDLPDLNIEQYINIAAAKSGALLSLPIELILCVADAAEAAKEAQKAARALAVGYQILDDLDDVEIDAALTDAPRALNILNVLTKNGHAIADARRAACTLAQSQLKLVNLHARRLPLDSGRTLLALASKLSAGLHAHCP
jgi:geranylgeranyl pyrophosphate synthase